MTMCGDSLGERVSGYLDYSETLSVLLGFFLTLPVTRETTALI